jgi:hypothetical protein
MRGESWIESSRSAPRGLAIPPADCPAHFEPGALRRGRIMALTAGQKVTLLKIDDALAMSHRYELEIRQTLDPQPVGYEGSKTRLAIVRQRRKRKDFYLDLAADDIVLEGWDVPFRTDTECAGVMAGNACYNLVGDSEAIREYIENRAALPVTDAAKAKIIVTRGERTKCDDSECELLYPEIETGHAVVNRMKGE